MIRDLIKRLLSKPRLTSNNKVLTLGARSIDNGINIVFRENASHSVRLTRGHLVIGSDSIVSGNFVFENGKGRISVGDRTFIGGGDFICISGITIGNDVLISWGCTLIDNDAHSLEFEIRKKDVLDWKRGVDDKKTGYYKNWSSVHSGPIVVKDKAWIGFKCSILKGVTVGEGAIIGAGSVVTRDVADWTIVAGNPAKVIRTLK